MGWLDSAWEVRRHPHRELVAPSPTKAWPGGSECGVHWLVGGSVPQTEAQVLDVEEGLVEEFGDVVVVQGVDHASGRCGRR